MDSVELYLPLIGLSVFIVGLIRVFIKADIAGSGSRPGTSNEDIRARFFQTLLGPESRLDLALIGVGVLILIAFVSYLSLS